MTEIIIALVLLAVAPVITYALGVDAGYRRGYRNGRGDGYRAQMTDTEQNGRHRYRV